MITYGFFDSINHDRVYDASELNRIFEGIITDGVLENVKSDDYLPFEVVASENQEMIVYVAKGKSWFNNSWTYNDSLFPVLIAGPTGSLNRIDAVIINVDQNNRANTITVVQGEADSGTPSRPVLSDTQYPLAYITINAGTTYITSDKITNVVGTPDGPQYVTAIVDQYAMDNLLAQWDTDFENSFLEFVNDKNERFDTWKDGIVNELSSSEIGALQVAIEGKETASKSLTKTLSLGVSELSFTDDSINDNSFISIYSSPYGAELIDANQIGHNLNLVFKDTNTEYIIKVLVRD